MPFRLVDGLLVGENSCLKLRMQSGQSLRMIHKVDTGNESPGSSHGEDQVDTVPEKPTGSGLNQWKSTVESSIAGLGDSIKHISDSLQVLVVLHQVLVKKGSQKRLCLKRLYLKRKRFQQKIVLEE